MLSVTRVDSRRVLVLGLAGLLPAALVTLLLVHQPSVGSRRLYPLLRGPLTLVGLGLAVLTLITWATAPGRVSRSSLSGLAWAGVAAILCIGPFLESTPRIRLYALDLATGDVVWATSRAGTAPVLVDGDLVVTDLEGLAFVGLDPATGRQRWRHPVGAVGTLPVVDRAVAAGAFVPSAALPTAAAAAVPPDAAVLVVDGRLQGVPEGGEPGWSLALPGERAVAVAVTGSRAYAYVATPGADGVPGGAVVAVDVADGRILWRAALPHVVSAGAGTAAIGADGDAVVVAGGERIGVLGADDGQLRWTESVVTLGKSRGYALPGAIQHVTVTDTLVFLATAPNS